MTVRNAASMGTYGADWIARGYSGQGQVGELIGSLAGRSAVIAGNGAGVLAEVEAACALASEPVIFAVNDIGMYLPTVDHWVSLHVDKLLAWRSVRWMESHAGESLKCHSCTARPWLDYCWQQLTPQFSLSGYFAMQLAWIMGCERIVLCGCPGDRTPRWFESVPRDCDYGADRDTHGIRLQVEKEMARVPGFKRAVRSMSGWTREYFGEV